MRRPNAATPEKFSTLRARDGTTSSPATRVGVRVFPREAKPDRAATAARRRLAATRAEAALDRDGNGVRAGSHTPARPSGCARIAGRSVQGWRREGPHQPRFRLARDQIRPGVPSAGGGTGSHFGISGTLTGNPCKHFPVVASSACSRRVLLPTTPSLAGLAARSCGLVTPSTVTLLPRRPDRPHAPIPGRSLLGPEPDRSGLSCKPMPEERMSYASLASITPATRYRRELTGTSPPLLSEVIDVPKRRDIGNTP